MATDPKTLFGVFWIASVLGLFLDWLVWRGNKKYTEIYLHLYSVLPLSKRGAARFLAARVWLIAAFLSVVTGMCLLLFVFPEQAREITGKRPPILTPFVILFYGGLAMGAFVSIFGKPRWAIPKILRDKVE